MKERNVKSLLTIIAILLTTISISAQPTTITYQGKLLDASGNPITNPALSMSFSIYSAETVGNLIWGPEVKSVNVQDGLYTVYLGESPTTFDASHFSATEDRYLQVTVGTTILPRTKIRIVPYAYKAMSLADEAWASPVDIGATAPANGTFTSLLVGGNPVLCSVNTDATLIGNGTSGDPLGIDLNNANSWTASQSFTNIEAASIESTSGSFTSIESGSV